MIMKLAKFIIGNFLLVSGISSVRAIITAYKFNPGKGNSSKNFLARFDKFCLEISDNFLDSTTNYITLGLNAAYYSKNIFNIVKNIAPSLRMLMGLLVVEVSLAIPFLIIAAAGAATLTIIHKQSDFIGKKIKSYLGFKPNTDQAPVIAPEETAQQKLDKFKQLSVNKFLTAVGMGALADILFAGQQYFGLFTKKISTSLLGMVKSPEQEPNTDSNNQSFNYSEKFINNFTDLAFNSKLTNLALASMAMVGLGYVLIPSAREHMNLTGFIKLLQGEFNAPVDLVNNYSFSKIGSEFASGNKWAQSVSAPSIGSSHKFP